MNIFKLSASTLFAPEEITWVLMTPLNFTTSLRNCSTRALAGADQLVRASSHITKGHRFYFWSGQGQVINVSHIDVSLSFPLPNLSSGEHLKKARISGINEM